jgi:hypothetical protein
VSVASSLSSAEPASERNPGQYLEEDGSERVDVRSLVDVANLRPALLGGHVPGRTDQGAHLGARIAVLRGDTHGDLVLAHFDAHDLRDAPVEN